MLKYLDTASALIDKVLQLALAVMAVVILLVNLAQIAGRYLFFYSIRWSEELSTYMYVWIIFLSLHMITREKVELTIDVIKTPDARKRATVAVLRDVVSLVTIAVMFVASVMMIRNSMAFPRRTASLGITTYPLYMCMPVGLGLAMLQKFTNMLRHLRDRADAGGNGVTR